MECEEQLLCGCGKITKLNCTLLQHHLGRFVIYYLSILNLLIFLLLGVLISCYFCFIAESNRKLIFCIKLDESEIVKDEKMECVRLVLMNRSLYQEKIPESMKFSVQSEFNHWWLGAFQVPSEIHQILKWVFSQTRIPEVIDKHNNG